LCSDSGRGEVALTKGKQKKILKSFPVKGELVRPGAFVFCERESGKTRLQVEASQDGTLPVERAASLLAMICMARGQTPAEYTMLVVPQGCLLGPVERRASELLEAGRKVRFDISLTSREHEVLQWVLRSMSNKEIAARMHICERTIKFHVSALLAKFKVRDRFTLIRRLMFDMRPAEAAPLGEIVELVPRPPEPRGSEPESGRSAVASRGLRRMTPRLA
jgi:DNA-binding CsgD family transcriptional regulator